MISSLNRDQKLDKRFKLEEDGWSQCDLTVYQQWMHAVELDIQDDLFQKDWEKFWHFKTIRLMSLGVDDVVKLVETYNQHTPHIGSIITVQDAHPLDLKTIRAKLSEIFGKFDDPPNQNIFRFSSNELEVILEFKGFEIKVVEKQKSTDTLSEEIQRTQ